VSLSEYKLFAYFEISSMKLGVFQIIQAQTQIKSSHKLSGIKMTKTFQSATYQKLLKNVLVRNTSLVYTKHHEQNEEQSMHQ